MKWQQDESTSRHYVQIWGPAVFIALVALVVAYQFVDPAPPKRIVIATGLIGGSYYAFAERYRDILARDGIELEVRATEGSLENIELLETPDAGVDVAFVQGGTSIFAQTDQLRSLASLYFEPLWLFERDGVEISRPSDLEGRRVSIGPPGSGTRAVMMQLLAENGIAESDLIVTDLDGDAAIDALIDGSLDVFFVVTSPESSYVQRAIRSDGIVMTSVDRPEAYTRRYKFLSMQTLPEGVIDLEANLPPGTVTLLAPAATLVVHEDFHPALVDLLLEAADEVHGPGGLFEGQREFPAPRYLDFPLSKEARRFFESGPPFLRRTLPFWAATLIDRLKVMLLPLIALVIPLMKIMPSIYRWRVRSRVYRWYKELRIMERKIRVGRSKGEEQDVKTALDRIEAEVRKVSIPWSYAEELYQLRVHIQYVRDQLQAAAS